MKASQHPQLGRVTAIMQRAAFDLQNDPMNDYAGFTPDSTPQLERIVQKEGFANLRHFEAVVQKRTTSRWAYMNLGF